MPVYRDIKNKRWYFVVTINYKQYKRVKYNNSYMLSKTEALACERDFINSLDLNTSDISLYQLFNEYIETTKSTLKISTQNNYDKFKNNYLVLLDDKKIKDLTIQDINLWKSKINLLDVSIAYKNRMQNIFKNVLNYGALAYQLKLNLQLPLLQPFKENAIKNIDKKEKWLKKAEFMKLIETLESGSYWFVVLWVLYFTGLRIGELAALQVNDIKIDHIIVNKDFMRVKGVDYIQPPKNSNSIRKVPIDETTSKILFDFIKDKDKESYIFSKGKHFLSQQKLRRVIKTLQAESNLEELYISPHTLRHSYSSNLKALGFNEYVISKLMGNTPEVASSTYIHADINFDEINKKMGKN